VYKENGVALSGPSYNQAKQGRKKSMKELKQGDLVFFGSGRKVSHVAIVANVSRNKIEVIHSTSSRGVVVDDISNSKYWKKRYMFGRDVL
jgi:cell wall-associated NlpC family hydrolase